MVLSWERSCSGDEQSPEAMTACCPPTVPKQAKVWAASGDLHGSEVALSKSGQWASPGSAPLLVLWSKVTTFFSALTVVGDGPPVPSRVPRALKQRLRRCNCQVRVWKLRSWVPDRHPPKNFNHQYLCPRSENKAIVSGNCRSREAAEQGLTIKRTEARRVFCAYFSVKWR